MIFVSPQRCASLQNPCRCNGPPGQSARSQQYKVLLASRQPPKRQRAFLQSFGVWRTAGIWIAFRSRQNRNCTFALGYAAQSAVPETDVALPAFKIALGRYHHSELLSRFPLQRCKHKRTRRIRHQSADRDDTGTTFDFIKYLAAFCALADRVQHVLKC